MEEGTRFKIIQLNKHLSSFWLLSK